MRFSFSRFFRRFILLPDYKPVLLSRTTFDPSIQLKNGDVLKLEVELPSGEVKVIGVEKEEPDDPA